MLNPRATELIDVAGIILGALQRLIYNFFAVQSNSRETKFAKTHDITSTRITMGANRIRSDPFPVITYICMY